MHLSGGIMKAKGIEIEFQDLPKDNVNKKDLSLLIEEFLDGKFGSDNPSEWVQDEVVVPYHNDIILFEMILFHKKYYVPVLQNSYNGITKVCVLSAERGTYEFKTDRREFR